jgi:hypothetical protein
MSVPASSGESPAPSAKRAPSAYNRFVKAVWPRLKAAQPGTSSSHLMKAASMEWSKLSQEEKNTYKA